jgi:hypothetical protein
LAALEFVRAQKQNVNLASSMSGYGGVEHEPELPVGTHILLGPTGNSVREWS